MGKRTCVFLWVLRKIINNCLSKGYTILENCDFAVVFLFVVHGFSAGHLNHIINETTASGFHRLIFYDDTGIEVNPAGLMRRQVGLVEIFIVGTKVPNGVPRPVVNSTMWQPEEARAVAATRSLPGATAGSVPSSASALRRPSRLIRNSFRISVCNPVLFLPV